MSREVYQRSVLFNKMNPFSNFFDGSTDAWTRGKCNRSPDALLTKGHRIEELFATNVWLIWHLDSRISPDSPEGSSDLTSSLETATIGTQFSDLHKKLSIFSSRWRLSPFPFTKSAQLLRTINPKDSTIGESFNSIGVTKISKSLTSTFALLPSTQPLRWRP